MRRRQFLDSLFIEVQHGLSTLTHQFSTGRPSPGAHRINPDLDTREIRKSQGFMRVNHTGEVCAQALYRGQAAASHNPELKKHLEQAATEEVDHLLWCKERLNELGTHESYLNPLWYLSSFLLGFVTAKKSDAVSLGFVEETEKQVMAHLEKHKATLPQQDHKSRAIIDVMKTDEEHHAQNAKTLGAAPLSDLMKWMMKLQSRVMTGTAYFI